MTKSAAPRMNVKLLRKIQKHILEEPKRFLMGDICQIENPEYPDEEVYDASAGENKHFDFAPCGTAACIAGWTLILSGQKPRHVSRLINPMQIAARLLGIADEDQLFMTYGWPRRFRDKYEAAKTPAGRARVAANRISHFIKTKGAE